MFYPTLLEGMFFGGLLILMIVYVSLYAIFKTRDYRNYSYFLFCALGTFFYMSGYAPQLIASPRLSEPIFATIALAWAHASIQFSRHFLSLNENTPIWDKLIGALQWVPLMGVIPVVFIPSIKVGIVLKCMTLLSIPVAYAAWLRLKQGFKPARFCIIEFWVLIFSMTFLTLDTLNLLPINLFTTYLHQATALLETVLFGLSISYLQRINEMSTADAKNEFLGMISHELKTPLQTIGSSIDLLTLRMPKQDAVFGRLRDAANNLERQVKDLTDYSMLESGALKFQNSNFSASKLLADTVENFRTAAANKGLKIRTKIEADVMICSDPYRLQQILNNLIANAIKYTNSGFIDVEMKFSPEWPSKLKIIIKDTGIGISPGYMAKLFNPFSQFDQSNKRDHTGMGMGLAIVHRLVKSFGGTIKVDSTLGNGSSFKLRIPAERAFNTTINHASINNESSFGTRILIVDDLEEVRINLNAMLDMFGYQCDLADSGKIAITLMKIKKYSMVLLDINMPEMNGFEVAEQIRNSNGINKQTPIIWISASSPENFTADQKRNFNYFLEKPVRADKLQMVLKNFSE